LVWPITAPLHDPGNNVTCPLVDVEITIRQ
jgi:hypothetical protein